MNNKQLLSLQSINLEPGKLKNNFEYILHTKFGIKNILELIQVNNVKDEVERESIQEVYYGIYGGFGENLKIYLQNYLSKYGSENELGISLDQYNKILEVIDYYSIKSRLQRDISDALIDPDWGSYTKPYFDFIEKYSELPEIGLTKNNIKLLQEVAHQNLIKNSMAYLDSYISEGNTLPDHSMLILLSYLQNYGEQETLTRDTYRKYLQWSYLLYFEKDKIENGSNKKEDLSVIRDNISKKTNGKLIGINNNIENIINKLKSKEYNNYSVLDLLDF